MNQKHLLSGAMLALSLALAGGCTNLAGPGPSQPTVQAATGAVKVTFQGDIAKLRKTQATVEDITQLTIRLETTNGTKTQTLTREQLTDGTGDVTFEQLLPGAATASVQVFDAPGRTIGQASATTTIVAAQTTDVSLSVTLEDGVGFGNNPTPPPPTSLAANVTVNDGTLTTLTGAMNGNFTTQGATLQTARYGHAATTTNGYVYVLGGRNADGPLSSVEKAAYGLDGSLGAFSAGPSLVASRRDPALANDGEHVYVSGGWSGSYHKSVERAAINADGTLGAFATQSAELVTARAHHAMVRIGDYLYVIGGMNSESDAIGTIERAPINEDGSLGAFADVSGVVLEDPRSGHSCVVTGEYLYVVGGNTTNNSSSGLSAVERAAINEDGTIAPFEKLDNVILPTRRSFHATVRAGQYLYLLGGADLTAGPFYSTTIDRATIYSDGSLSNFETIANVTSSGQSLFAGAQAGKYLYLFGGWAGTSAADIVQRATLQ